MHFGFSYVGLIFLVMLMVPNLLWTRHRPEQYEEYAKHENKVLLFCEHAGEVSVCCLLLIFSDFNPHGLTPWLGWLIGAGVLMVFYEAYWIRYFRSEQTMQDFYGSMLGIPVPGASLPVVAVLLIAFYGGNPFLLAAGLILGVGHIGIHSMHKKEITS